MDDLGLDEVIEILTKASRTGRKLSEWEVGRVQGIILDAERSKRRQEALEMLQRVRERMRSSSSVFGPDQS